MKASITATLVRLGDCPEIGTERAAVFQCKSENDCRKLGAALLSEAAVAVEVPEHVDSPMPRQYLRVPLAGRVCPECGEPVTVLAVESPAIVNLLVNPDPTERVVKRSDGSYAVSATYILHADTCPKWPDEQRDWRASIGTNEEA